MKRLPLVLSLWLLLAATGGLRADDPQSADDAIKKALDAADGPRQNGDIAWMLVSTALVFLMVPGLALFYGGMVRRKNVLATMMQSMVALAIVGLQWLLVGYCLAFGTSQGGVIGWDSRLIGLASPDLYAANFSNTKVPIFLHCMYQGMFAIITPALISGAFAERVRFGPYCLFVLLWSLLVYDPLAHWVWSLDANGNATGWLGKLPAYDFAGGTVVHIAAGFSGLAAIFVLRHRFGHPEHVIHPSSMVITLVGAGLLWFGWFGFNGGSALASNLQAGMALTASQVAAAAAALSWMVVEWAHRGKPTALGLASGLVAGLVAVTPAAGFVTPIAALAIGVLAGVVCYGAVLLKGVVKYDDSLDAFGIHGIGGFLGAVLTGVFASAVLYKAGTGGDIPGHGGWLYDGQFGQVLSQLIAASVAGVFSFGITLVLVGGIDGLFGFCVDAKAENVGLDQSQHGEAGFDLGPSLDQAPEHEPREPRSALVPPDGQKRRFTVIVDGAPETDLMQAWANLCQSGPTPPPADFKTLYPYLTTVQGNRFRFRGGDPTEMRLALQHLLQEQLDGTPVHAYVES